MIKHIETLIIDAIQTLQKTYFNALNIPAFKVEYARDLKHGNITCNFALIAAKVFKRNPHQIAEWLIQELPASPYIKKVEIAGPGFMNFFLTNEAYYQTVLDIIQCPSEYGKANIGNGKRIIIEFVSANPTGPLHVGHGRHAAYGATLSNLLSHIGYRVHREYYINDAGRQMDILAMSTWLRYLEYCGRTFIFPSNGYQGEYVREIAKKIYQAHGTIYDCLPSIVFDLLPLDEQEGGNKEIYTDALVARVKSMLGDHYSLFFDCAKNDILDDIKNDLIEFGIHYDEWFSESQFVKTDCITQMIEQLKKQELTYEKEGALWFRSSVYGDEKDRVLMRRNGTYTYFAHDLGYHINKFERGFDQAIDILGADHHGYVPRIQAGVKAFGFKDDQLSYRLGQFVTLYRKGQQVQMSTRSGSFVTLRELRHEVGCDVARFFYMTRKYDQHIDFDLDLATSNSSDNPVYYIQYAHSRICSVFRQLKEKKLTYDPIHTVDGLACLDQAIELDLMIQLQRYPSLIEYAALQGEPHVLTHYLRELASHFHVYYNSSIFLVKSHSLRSARLMLVDAIRYVILSGLTLLGVSAPERMISEKVD